MIELIEVSKSYNTRKRKSINALTNINLSFLNQGFYTIIGKSGSGKSTLLNILAGLVKPTSGKYLINGEDTTDYSEQDWVNLRKTTLSYIFQKHNLFNHLTVKENLMISLWNKFAEAEILQKIDCILEKFELMDVKDQVCSELSGGESQRVAIIRALLSDSQIIIADEPTSSLDKSNTHAVYELLRIVAETKLVIVVTHDVEMANLYSDYLININYGELESKPLQKKDEIIISPVHRKQQLPVKNVFRIAHLLDKKRRFFNYFMITFLVISMTLLTVAITLNIFNGVKLEHQVMSNKENLLSFISSSDTQLVVDEKVSDAKLEDRLEGISFSKSYSGQFNFYTNMMNQSDSGQRIFRTVIESNLEDNQIIITDYQADVFKSEGILYFNDYTEIIGKSMVLGDVPLYIERVIDTLYKTDQKINDQRLLMKYDVLRVNTYTLNQMLPYEDISINTNYGQTTLRHPSYFQSLSENSYRGSLEIHDNQIVLDYASLHMITGAYFEKPEDAEAYLGTVVSLEIEIDSMKISQEFMIQGIVYSVHDVQGLISLSLDMYEDIFKGNLLLVRPYNRTYALNHLDFKAFKQLRYFLEQEDLYIVNIHSDDVFQVSAFIQAMSKLFVVVSIVSALLTALFVYFFSKTSFKQNEYNYGLLYSLGYSRMQTINISLVSIIKKVLIAFLLSSIITAILVVWFNDNTKKDLDITIDVLSFNLIPYIMTLVFSIVLALLSLISSFIFIHKIEIIQLLNKA